MNDLPKRLRLHASRASRVGAALNSSPSPDAQRFIADMAEAADEIEAMRRLLDGAVFIDYGDDFWRAEDEG